MSQHPRDNPYRPIAIFVPGACICSAPAQHLRIMKDQDLTDFSSLGLPEILTNSLKAAGFETPTKIQSQAIPKLLEGRDMLG
ncbi:MAG: hypothetical protein EOP02_12930, partial [Proteobacteria bacterium]